MKKIYFLFLIFIVIYNCGSAKKRSSDTSKKPERIVVKKQSSSKRSVSKKAQSIIDYAKTFKGTRYKYGGTTKKGIDCSGLVYRSFGANDISMPRSSTELSRTGNWIDIKKVKEGDLVFFATRKNSRKINHVGIVTDVSDGDISFIHSSSSRGVIISKVSERYWYLAYVQARRYL